MVVLPEELERIHEFFGAYITPVSDKGAGEGVSFVIPALFVVPTKAGIQTLENLKLSPHRVD